MTRIGLKFKFLGAAAAIVLVLVAFGCSNQEGQTPATANGTSGYQPGHVFNDPDIVRINPPSKNGGPIIQMSSTVKTEVSALLGGTVTNGRVSLYFPPGALAQDTEIEMEMDPTGLFITDMGPDGLVFQQPVILNFDLVGTSAEGQASSTYIAWFDESLNQWEMIENLPPVGPNHIQGVLEHFSKYSGVGG